MRGFQQKLRQNRKSYNKTDRRREKQGEMKRGKLELKDKLKFNDETKTETKRIYTQRKIKIDRQKNRQTNV